MTKLRRDSSRGHTAIPLLEGPRTEAKLDMPSKGQNPPHKSDPICASSARKHPPALNHRAAGEPKVLCETGNILLERSLGDGLVD